MQWIDIGIISIIIISALISLARGFVREALSLVGLITAIWIGLHFSQDLAALLVNYISVSSLRVIIAFTTLFVITLFLSALINYLASQLVKKTGLSGTDRLIGVLFGIARGGVVIGILVLLAQLTSLPQDPWWKQSILIGHFQNLANWMGGTLPSDVTTNLAHK